MNSVDECDENVSKSRAMKSGGRIEGTNNYKNPSLGSVSRQEPQMGSAYVDGGVKIGGVERRTGDAPQLGSESISLDNVIRENNHYAASPSIRANTGVEVNRAVNYVPSNVFYSRSSPQNWQSEEPVIRPQETVIGQPQGPVIGQVSNFQESYQPPNVFDRPAPGGRHYQIGEGTVINSNLIL